MLFRSNRPNAVDASIILPAPIFPLALLAACLTALFAAFFILARKTQVLSTLVLQAVTQLAPVPDRAVLREDVLRPGRALQSRRQPSCRMLFVTCRPIGCLFSPPSDAPSSRRPTQGAAASKA